MTELTPPIQNERERQIFTNMQKELERDRKVNPSAKFSHVDLEWGAVGDDD